MRHIKTDGIILRKNNFNEHDQFVTIFTPELGKIEAVAKGSRKITSPFLGHLETLNICAFQLYNSGHTFTITQCQTRKTFKPIRADFEKTIQAILLGEIFHKTALGHERNHALFNLVEQALSHLCVSNNNSLCLESFKIKLLYELGLLPQISSCSLCHKKWADEEVVLIDQYGHITCNTCRLSSESYRTIPFNIMKLINYIGLAEFCAIESICLKADEEQILKRFGDYFLNQFTNKELVSEKMLSLI